MYSRNITLMYINIKYVPSQSTFKDDDLIKSIIKIQYGNNDNRTKKILCFRYYIIPVQDSRNCIYIHNNL